MRASLQFSVRHDETVAKETVARIFEKPILRHRDSLRDFLSIPLRRSTGEIASLITELLLTGYMLTADESVVFHFNEYAESEI